MHRNVVCLGNWKCLIKEVWMWEELKNVKKVCKKACVVYCVSRKCKEEYVESWEKHNKKRCFKKYYQRVGNWRKVGGACSKNPFKKLNFMYQRKRGLATEQVRYKFFSRFFSEWEELDKSFFKQFTLMYLTLKGRSLCKNVLN